MPRVFCCTGWQASVSLPFTPDDVQLLTAHSTHCPASGQLHAMINDSGELFYPDDLSEALWFIEEHGASFVHGGWPWADKP